MSNRISPVSQPMRTSYNDIPYPRLCHPQTHPDRLATIATLLGLDPTPVTHCRVLEIGCAVGGNLLPMAAGLPDSQFLGIDASPVQIANARAAVHTLALDNVHFEVIDIRNLPPDLGLFDYIIAHGVYSWVPPSVAEALLAACGRFLTPNGIAYVSYNVYPGWYAMAMVRDALNFHMREVGEPRERARKARAFLAFLAECATDETPYSNFIKAYAVFLEGKFQDAGSEEDSLLLHSTLEEDNHPVYFHEFMEQAHRQGLQYLAEAKLSDVFPQELSVEAQQFLRRASTDTVEWEQYLDIVRNKMFRQTLLCRSEISIDRRLSPERIRGLWVMASGRPVSNTQDIKNPGVETFRSLDGAKITTDHPVSKAALNYLAQANPRAVPFEELMAQARGRAGLPTGSHTYRGGGARDAYALAANLLQAYGYSDQLVSLHVCAPPVAHEAGERPCASPVARLFAQDSNRVPNLWHIQVALTPEQQLLLQLLDGTQDRTHLLEKFTEAIRNDPRVASPDQAMTDHERTQLLNSGLDSLARAAFLIE